MVRQQSASAWERTLHFFRPSDGTCSGFLRWDANGEIKKVLGGTCERRGLEDFNDLRKEVSFCFFGISLETPGALVYQLREANAPRRGGCAERDG